MKSEKTTPSRKLSVKSAEFSFDDLLEVWYYAMIQGATLWQYCQDNKYTLPDDFNTGLEAVRKHVNDASTLKYILSTTPLAVGLFDELLQATINTSVTTGQTKASTKKKTVSKKVK